jgi:hypothetical protein
VERTGSPVSRNGQRYVFLTKSGVPVAAQVPII